MVKFVMMFSLLISLSAAANNKVIYGDDNRLDIVDVTNALHKQLAASTAAMVENRKMRKSTLAQGQCELGFGQTLATGQNVCRTERFADQPVGAMCSGFLVGEDTLVTAGHCLKMLGSMGYPTAESVCKGFSWVFNYAVDRPGRNPLVGSNNDVYGCKQVIAAELTRTHDFAVIKLDRKVVGRAALKFRQSGKIANNTELVVIGHPSGLPSKVADGARVTGNSDAVTFVTNLDTFHGNSGSAVFDAKTGLVEGILVQGQTDYTSSTNDPFSCKVVNVCDESGRNCDEPNSPMAPKGEVVTRITALLTQIKAANAPARRPARR